MYSRTQVKKHLWNLFSQYIRTRDLRFGCISCNRRFCNYKDGDAGHYFPKGTYENLRYDEDNVHLQCRHCNLNMQDPVINEKYKENLINKIGEKRFERLKTLAKTPYKREKEIEYYKLINKYFPIVNEKTKPNCPQKIYKISKEICK